MQGFQLIVRIAVDAGQIPEPQAALLDQVLEEELAGNTVRLI